MPITGSSPGAGTASFTLPIDMAGDALEREMAWGRQVFDARRAFDIAVTLLLLPLALVIGSITALAIFLDSPGPVFYRSRRLGAGGREFEMLKFRKFRRAAKGTALTTDGDERFTPIGRLLAVTKLDELPQLWNVLKGDMRLVGPRPEVVEFVECYPEHYERILRVVPGITGPAALAYSDESYLLGEQADPVAFYRAELLPKKIDIDLAYAEDHSVRGDIAILVRTLWVPLRQLRRRMRFVHARDARAGRDHTRLMPVLVAGALLVACFALASATPV